MRLGSTVELMLRWVGYSRGNKNTKKMLDLKWIEWLNSPKMLDVDNDDVENALNLIIGPIFAAKETDSLSSYKSWQSKMSCNPSITKRSPKTFQPKSRHVKTFANRPSFTFALSTDRVRPWIIYQENKKKSLWNFQNPIGVKQI